MIAAAFLQAALVSPGFSPPLDAPLRIVTERIETSPEERRYRLERVVRFAREPTGYRAEVTIVSTQVSGPPSLAGLVERGFAGFKGRPILLHFDARGAVLEVEDLARLWEQLCQAIAEGAAARRSLPPSEAAQLAARFAGPLRALPVERQRATLATLVTPAFASEPVEPPGVTRAVQLPGASPFGTPLTLTGERSSSRDAAGLFVAQTHATGSVLLPAEGAAPPRFGKVAVRRTLRFDSQTGLIASADDTSHTTIGSGADARKMVLVTSTRTALVSD